MSTRILFVEDDPHVRNVLLGAVEDQFEAAAVATAEAALEMLAREVFDIVVADVRLPGMSGLDLLPHLPRLRPGIISLIITGHGTIDMAVEAMKRGATDFLTKPFTPDELLGALQVAAERVSRKALSSPGGVSGINVVAESSAMRAVIEQVTAIAPFNTTVLITGETGTGKELVARALHQHSPRRNRPLVAMNCAAVPEQLLEDELFGHVKGAFTGAQNAREGRFEQADGGTLFLDEIGDMSLALQSKLLRVLQEREFEKLGSSRTTKVDVRIVAATSADLERRVSEGSFRADLYYRLNVVHLRLPPLRARREDIRPLAEKLLERFCLSAGLPAKLIADEVMETLGKYHWPGNVRQLQNAMERAAALSGAATVIRLSDLPEEVRQATAHGFGVLPGGMNATVTAMPKSVAQPSAFIPATIPDEGLSYDAIVARVERELLLQSLNKTGGNKVRAARLLQMKRTTFSEKLKRLQIEDSLADDDSEDEAQAQAS
ncbi:MAG TPA: sigma-54 dependent transcriptional regulator [Blastocatellia bacterium]|nr:sigma-54 dependent transcriptional regulator [Blastocatellia bacterium]